MHTSRWNAHGERDVALRALFEVTLKPGRLRSNYLSARQVVQGRLSQCETASFAGGQAAFGALDLEKRPV